MVLTTVTPSRRENCVILVLASAPYDEADYLRDYGAFRAYVGQAERR